MFRATRKDIATIKIALRLLPSVAVREPAAGSSIDSTGFQIMRDECVAHDSIIKLGSAIVTKIMQTIEKAYDSQVEFSFPMHHIRQANLDYLSIKFVTFRADSPLEPAANAVYAQASASSTLPIVVGLESAMRYWITIELRWTVPREDQDPHFQACSYNHNSSHVSAPLPSLESDGKEILPYQSCFRHITNFIESKSHASFDMMAYEASKVAFTASEASLGPPRITDLRIAISDLGPKRPAKGTAYNISRSWNFNSEWYKRLNRAQKEISSYDESHRALIALGSNIGDRVGMIEQACSEMASRGLKLLRTSSLYETEAMYKTDQPSFVNGVCEIETTSSPPTLLDQLQDVENSLGRVKTVANGPRTIDLDILTYDDRIVDQPSLQIPHPRISEREFVLRPLC
ncbi:MAG: hypothetical protein Q9207_005151, partial [Kuettlingeria erythrocarpa]